MKRCCSLDSYNEFQFLRRFCVYCWFSLDVFKALQVLLLLVVISCSKLPINVTGVCLSLTSCLYGFSMSLWVFYVFLPRNIWSGIIAFYDLCLVCHRFYKMMFLAKSGLSLYMADFPPSFHINAQLHCNGLPIYYVKNGVQLCTVVITVAIFSDIINPKTNPIPKPILKDEFSNPPAWKFIWSYRYLGILLQAP